MVQRFGRWMSKPGLVFLMFVVLAALPANSAMAGFRFRLAFTYVDGLQDLADAYENNIEIEESGAFTYVDVDTMVWPVGISLLPYYQWDNGMLLGVGVGPFIYGQFEGWDDDYTHWQVPVNLNIGYVVGPDNPVSFYVRGGPSYHFAGGDYYDGSSLGFVGAIGLELFDSSHFRMGLEAAYDTAEVDIDNLRTNGTDGIRVAEFSAGVFLLFK